MNCPECLSDDVSAERMSDGIVVYECNSCGNVWDSNETDDTDEDPVWAEDDDYEERRKRATHQCACGKVVYAIISDAGVWSWAEPVDVGGAVMLKACAVCPQCGAALPDRNDKGEGAP